MPQEQIEELFDELVPGAASRAGEFLGVIQRRCAEEGIGIELRVHKGLISRRRVLQGRLPVGKMSRRMELEVFAEPVGSALQVGWQVTKNVEKGVMSNFKSVAIAEGIRDRFDYSANNQRQMSALLTAFHRMVFEPVVLQLTQAVEKTQMNEFLDTP